MVSTTLSYQRTYAACKSGFDAILCLSRLFLVHKISFLDESGLLIGNNEERRRVRMNIPLGKFLTAGSLLALPCYNHMDWVPDRWTQNRCCCFF